MAKDALLRVAVRQALNPAERRVVARLVRDDREAAKAHARLLTMRGKYGPGHRDELSGYVEQAQARMTEAYRELKDFCESLNEAHNAAR